MADEILGTSVIVTKASGEIVGQGDFTMTVGGTLIPISNKSYGDFITYLDGSTAEKQLIFAGTITYNSDAVFHAVRADSLTGTQDDYTMTYPNGESFTGKFAPTGLSDNLGRGVAIATTISFNSSGEYTHTPYVAV